MNEGEVLVEGDAETVRANAEVQRVYIGGQGITSRTRAARRGRRPAQPLLGVSGVNTYYGKSHILHDVSFEVRER